MLRMLSYKYGLYKWQPLMSLAWMLPRRLVYFAAIRVVAYATTEQYSNTDVNELKVMDAIARWEQPPTES